MHRPLDKLTPEKLELSLGVVVGQGVILHLEMLSTAIISKFLGVCPGVVPLGMPFQGDWTNPLLLVLIVAIINFIFIKRTIFIISPPYKTLAMLEWLFFLLPLQVVPLDVINGTRKRSPLGYSMVRCLPLLRQHLALLRSLSAALLLSVWFLLV